MGFGSDAVQGWRKYDHAACVIVVLAYLALQQQDRVGLLMFDEEIKRILRPSSAHDHWRAIVDALGNVQFAPAGRDPADMEGRRTDLGRLFEQVTARLTQRSLVVLVSDLFDDPASLERGLARMHFRRHDVVVVQVMDSAELQFPYRVGREFIGLEGEGRLPLEPAALRAAYLEVMGEHLRAVEGVAHKFQFEHLLVDTSMSVGPPLSHLLARRAAAASRGR